MGQQNTELKDAPGGRFFVGLAVAVAFGTVFWGSLLWLAIRLSTS